MYYFYVLMKVNGIIFILEVPPRIKHEPTM